MVKRLYIEDSLPNLGLMQEFKTVRANALANPNLYGGRYTQDDIEEAWEQFKLDKVKGNTQ